MDIRLAKYKIFNGRNRSIKLALRVVEQANMDPWVLFETKITGGVYTHRLLEQNVLASEATSKHQGGVLLFFRESPHCNIKSHQSFGPHIIIFHMV